MNKDIDFGDYVRIEMANNQHQSFFVHKVIGARYSNLYKDVPIKTASEEVLHKNVEPVLSVIQCGPVEREIFNVRVSDCKKVSTLEQCDLEEAVKFHEAACEVLTSDQIKEIEDFMESGDF